MPGSGPLPGPDPGDPGDSASGPQHRGGPDRAPGSAPGRLGPDARAAAKERSPALTARIAQQYSQQNSETAASWPRGVPWNSELKEQSVASSYTDFASAPTWIVINHAKIFPVVEDEVAHPEHGDYPIPEFDPGMQRRRLGEMGAGFGLTGRGRGGGKRNEQWEDQSCENTGRTPGCPHMTPCAAHQSPKTPSPILVGRTHTTVRY